MPCFPETVILRARSSEKADSDSENERVAFFDQCSVEPPRLGIIELQDKRVDDRIIGLTPKSSF
jgi:hypothetical protein